MNIEKVKHEVLNNNVAIEYDNGDLEKLINVLEYIFPDYKYTIKEAGKFFIKESFENKKWDYLMKFNGNSIPLSQITFDTTLNDVIELRKKFPNNMIFGDKFDELLNKMK